MDIRKLDNGRYVYASFKSTTKRFRSTLTTDFTPVESVNLNLIPKIRTYKNPESLARAVRKYKAKL